jgi:hypothetical protein
VRIVLLAALAAGCVTQGGSMDPSHPGEPDAPVTPTVDAHVPDRYLPPDATPPTGSVGYTGGSVDRLVFGVFGDVRPMDLDMAGEYPTAVIDAIFEEMGGSYAEFAIGTGDYMYADTKTQVDSQLADLVAAEKKMGSRPIFHAMGNHECNGDTSSNCPNGTETANMVGFMTTLLSFTTKPYYSFNVTTAQGEAKFVVIAANAWSTAQSTWLDTELAKPTKYTIVVRHEADDDPRAPGVTPSDAIIAAHPVTLFLYGHDHTYQRVGYNGVICGNSGAPQNGYYGWLLVEQEANGNLVVSSINKDNSEVIDRWAVDPTGKTATP